MTEIVVDRAGLIHCAKVYLNEARRRRGTPFAHVLIEWAGNCRRRAMSLPKQRELFA